jgi:hypothetical protein
MRKHTDGASATAQGVINIAKRFVVPQEITLPERVLSLSAVVVLIGVFGHAPSALLQTLVAKGLYILWFEDCFAES